MTPWTVAHSVHGMLQARILDGLPFEFLSCESGEPRSPAERTDSSLTEAPEESDAGQGSDPYSVV